MIKIDMHNNPTREQEIVFALNSGKSITLRNFSTLQSQIYWRVSDARCWAARLQSPDGRTISFLA